MNAFMFTDNKHAPDYTHQKKLATFASEIVDPEITVKLEMRGVLKVHDAQT